MRADTAACSAAYAVRKRDRQLGLSIFAFRIMTPDAAERASLKKHRRDAKDGKKQGKKN